MVGNHSRFRHTAISMPQLAALWLLFWADWSCQAAYLKYLLRIGTSLPVQLSLKVCTSRSDGKYELGALYARYCLSCIWLCHEIAAKLQKMSLKQPAKDFGTVDQASHSLFHSSTPNRNDKDYKNSGQHDHRASAQSIRTENGQGQLYGDETNFYGRDAHIPAEDLITLGSLLASEPEVSRCTLDEENQSSRWEYRSSSQSFPSSLFGSTLEKDGDFPEKFVQCGRDSLKPTWRCFSYGEIFHATNNFHPGNKMMAATLFQ